MFRTSSILLLLIFLSSKLPAQDMPLSDVLLEGEGWQLVSSGHKFTEGPAVDAVGNLYFVDVPSDQILKHNFSTNQVEVFLEGAGNCSGLMFGPDGRLYASQNKNRKVIAIDSKGNIETIADELGANDLVVTSQGGVYCTDPKNHQVWYVTPEGEKRIVATEIQTPNGIILWPDESTLVVADTHGTHLIAFKIEAGGLLSARTPIYTCRVPNEETISGADGMTVDSKGRLYVATTLGIQMFDTQCRISGVIAKPQNKFLSNVAFGGENLEYLYATTADKVFRRKTQAQGIRYQAK